MGFFSKMIGESHNECYSSIESIEECLQQSHTETVLILKHSSTCPISSAAKNQVDRFLQDNKIKAYLLIVQNQRPLSLEIAEKLQIRHESPQLLCLKDGAVSKVFNHYEINGDNLQQIL